MPVDLVVLSVSRKGDGKSMIGLAGGGFVRLAPPSESGILYPQHFQIAGTIVPRPWDLIRVNAPWQDNRGLQPENRIVDQSAWQLLERPVSRPSLPEFPAPQQGPLFRDAMSAHSIACIDPLDVRAACVWHTSGERLRTRLLFTFSGESYDLPLLDSRWSEVLLAKGEGEYTLEQIGCRSPHGLRLIVSFEEPFRGKRYKIVTGILPWRGVTLWRNAPTPSISHAYRRPAGLPMECAHADHRETKVLR